MVHSSEQNSLDIWLSTARLLLVDDEPANLEFLGHVLAPEGYGEVIAIADPIEAVERYEELRPDLLIVDLMMPQLDGLGVIARVRAQQPNGSYVPILVATGDPTPDARRRALSAGARDFLTKPLSPAEVRLRVRNLLETRYLHEQLRQYNEVLEDRVAERTWELEQARLEVLVRLARAAEFRDDQTGQHILRVGLLSRRLAQVLELPAEACELIGRAAPLHDVGKIGIPDAILLKPGVLDVNEFAVMQSHTVMGAEILSGSQSPLLQVAEEIALSHHEWWNGDGYPQKRSGESIPLSARIVAVADVFDSLSHERRYKHAWTLRETIEYVEANAGRQFDPAVVRALVRVSPEASALECSARASLEWSLVRPARNGNGHAAPAAGSPLMATRLHALQAERDALAREVARLRQQLAQQESAATRVATFVN